MLLGVGVVNSRHSNILLRYFSSSYYFYLLCTGGFNKEKNWDQISNISFCLYFIYLSFLQKHSSKIPLTFLTMHKAQITALLIHIDTGLQCEACE